jgi:hypothetical protein
MLAKYANERFLISLTADDAAALLQDYCCLLETKGASYHPQAWEFIQRINYLYVQAHGCSLDECIDPFLEEE